MGFAGQLVEGAGEALGHLAAVDEEDGGVALADDFEQAGMNCVPDGDAAGHLRGGAAGRYLLLAEAGHVFDGNFNAELELLGRAGVDDGDGAVAELVRGAGNRDQGIGIRLGARSSVASGAKRLI